MIQLIADGLIVPIVIAGALAIWLWTPKPRLEAYKYALMAGLTSLLVAKLMSVIYHPATERPFQMLGEKAGALYIDNPGFPSDHALFVTVIVLAVYALTGHKKFALVLAVLALLVCIGRVVALVHTPLDVIGGVFAGLVGGLWYLTMQNSKSKRLR